MAAAPYNNKIMENKHPVSKPHHHLAVDHKKLVLSEDTKQQFLSFLKTRESQVQGMLLWCSIAVLVGYIALIFSIIKYCTTLKTGHPVYLMGMMLIIIALFGAFIWLQYKSTVCKPLGSHIIMKELLHFKVRVATKQLKLLVAAILSYSFIVLGSCILCWYYVANGPQNIINITAPISIMVYSAGLFLLVKLAIKRRKYLGCISLINSELINKFSKQ
jgi:hypothetical protein